MATTAQCKRALKLFENELSCRSNVVGLGIVPANDAPGATANRMAVAVYVRKKLPRVQLKPHDVVPRHLMVQGGGRFLRVPTRVIEQGDVRFEGELAGNVA